MAGLWCKGIDSVERDQYLDGKSRVGGYNERERLGWGWHPWEMESEVKTTGKMSSMRGSKVPFRGCPSRCAPIRAWKSIQAAEPHCCAVVKQQRCWGGRRGAPPEHQHCSSVSSSLLGQGVEGCGVDVKSLLYLSVRIWITLDDTIKRKKKRRKRKKQSSLSLPSTQNRNPHEQVDNEVEVQVIQKFRWLRNMSE